VNLLWDSIEGGVSLWLQLVLPILVVAWLVLSVFHRRTNRRLQECEEQPVAERITK
jgi:hypothetical protein